MKKAILTLLALLAALAPASAVAVDPPAYNVLLAGGDEANMIHIWLTADGREYVIDSVVPLEVGGASASTRKGRRTSWSATPLRSPASKSTPAAAKTKCRSPSRSRSR